MNYLGILMSSWKCIRCGYECVIGYELNNYIFIHSLLQTHTVVEYRMGRVLASTGCVLVYLEHLLHRFSWRCRVLSHPVTVSRGSRIDGDCRLPRLTPAIPPDDLDVRPGSVTDRGGPAEPRRGHEGRPSVDLEAQPWDCDPQG